MVVEIKGKTFHTMKDACERLGISRQTMLRYFADGFFSEPPRLPQGRNKKVRYFDDDWYKDNEKKLENARKD